MPNPNRKRLRRLGRVVFFLLILFSLLFTFGLSPEDEATFRSFDAASKRWQCNPEFRFVAMEYSCTGSAAMRTHLFLIPGKRVIIALRSIPFLPKEYAVNPTSRQHYQDFSQGALSAYLHLCSEQDVSEMIGSFVKAGKNTPSGDAELHRILDGYAMSFPVTKDIGAIQSVATVVRETNAGRDFSIKENIGPRLLEPIAHVAAQLGIPTDPTQMTAAQQETVFERLDSYVHATDPELWRTKQINDFCSGIWAQVYGPAYKTAIIPILVCHDVSKILLVMLLAFVIIRSLRMRPLESPAAETPVVAANPAQKPL